MERNYFYFLEYSDKVQDIRDQFPLLLLIEDTMLIAKELGIEHPTNTETGEFIVMTTDFLVSINYDNKFYEVARTIKSKDDLNEKDLSELQINKRNVAWEFIEKYWETNKCDLLEKNHRENKLMELANTSSLSLAKVKRIFSRYWQRGMNKNALLPDYNRVEAE